MAGGEMTGSTTARFENRTCRTSTSRRRPATTARCGGPVTSTITTFLWRRDRRGGLARGQGGGEGGRPSGRFDGGGTGGRTGPAAWLGASRLLAQVAGASELRCLVAAAGHGQDSCGATVEGAGDAGRQPVGSGRHLRGAGFVQSDEAQGYRQR